MPWLRQGAARLEFARAGGKTVVARAQARSPVRLLTPRNAGPAAWAYVSTFGGGLLAGDVIDLDVEVAPHAVAYLSTQSATKVFRSPDDRITRQTLRAHVAEEALLLLLPDPVSCFAGARYQQKQGIDLAPTGSLVLLDWLTSGRHARGERWGASSTSANEICIGDRCVVRDTLRLTPGTARLGMNYFNCFATLLLIGPHPALQQARASAATEALARAPIDPRSHTQFGISPLADGIILRAAGPDVESVAALLFPYLEFLTGVLGEAPWKRKW